MGEQKGIMLSAEDLRRLWHWVMNANPHQPWDVAELRAAAKCLEVVLNPQKTGSGLPGIPQDLCFSEVQVRFSTPALGGLALAMSQGISGESNVDRVPAPFGAIEHIILPLARTLGIEADLVARSAILRGSR